jgi:hypothetical protein
LWANGDGVGAGFRTQGFHLLLQKIDYVLGSLQAPRRWSALILYNGSQPVHQGFHSTNMAFDHSSSFTCKTPTKAYFLFVLDNHRICRRAW